MNIANSENIKNETIFNSKDDPVRSFIGNPLKGVLDIVEVIVNDIALSTYEGGPSYVRDMNRAADKSYANERARQVYTDKMWAERRITLTYTGK